MFIVRDENNTLILFHKKPHRKVCHDYELNEINYWDSSSNKMILPTNLFKDITWDSEPIEVELVIKEK